MLKENHGNHNSTYTGTINDIETIADCRSGYPKRNSREYEELKIVIFGYINIQKSCIDCAEGIEDIPKLEEVK